MDGLRLEPYDRTRRGETAGVLGRAFEADAYMTSLLPLDHRRRRLRDLYAASLVRADGSPHVVDLAVDAGTGRLLGAALWIPPESSGASLLGTMRALPLLLSALGARTRSTMRVFTAIERERPVAPHWYLSVVGVLPQAAGRGVGSALLAHGIARADAHHDPAYLEGASLGHTAFYERFGFRSLGPVDAPHPAPPVRMWRDER